MVTTEHYLWAIFALLFIALVLVVVTARRGPWEQPMKPCVADQCSDEHTVLIEGGVSTVIELGPAVDPLWGKNRP